MGMTLSLVVLAVAIALRSDLLGKIAFVVLLATILFPVLFTPVSCCWYGLARMLERLMSVIILSFVFYIVVTPVGLLRRCFAKDALRLRSFKKSRAGVFEIRHKEYRSEDLENQF
jgi:hypothetical protein